MDSMRRVLLGALAIVLLAGGLGGAPAQAASPYRSVTGIDGVLYDDCLSYPFRYDISVPTDAGYRDVQVDLYEPDGRFSQTVTVFPDSDVATGTGSFTLCTQADMYGSYTMRARLHWATNPGDQETTATLDDATFTLRKPHSQTTLTASTRRPATGQVVRYRVTAYDERPTGFARRAFAWVHLEQHKAGRWVRVKGGRAMTHATGQVVIRVRYAGHRHRTKLRAVTERTTRFTRSTSRPLRLW